MKANQASLALGDEAVSPVIAVILMVAITVVLAATVYIWVTGFAATGQQAPPVGMRTEAQKTNEWKVRVSSMSQGARAISEFRFNLVTPTNGTFVLNTTTFSTLQAEVTAATSTTVTVMSGTACSLAANEHCWRVQFIDADANAAFSTGDRIIVSYEDDVGSTAFDDTLPLGAYKLEINHLESGEQSGTVKATFA